MVCCVFLFIWKKHSFFKRRVISNYVIIVVYNLDFYYYICVLCIIYYNFNIFYYLFIEQILFLYIPQIGGTTKRFNVLPTFIHYYYYTN